MQLKKEIKIMKKAIKDANRDQQRIMRQRSAQKKWRNPKELNHRRYDPKMTEAQRHAAYRRCTAGMVDFY